MGRGLALVLRSPDDGTVAVRENFRLDGQDLVLRTGSEDRPTGFVEGLLVGQDGTRLEKPSIRVWNPETYRMAAAEFRGERFRVGPMPPGEYVLCAGAEGFPESLVLVQVEPYSTRDVGTLSLDWPGWIEVHLDCPGITLGPEEVVFTALFRDGGQWGALRDGPAAEKPPRGMCALGASIAEPLPPRGRSRPLAPGRYLLRTQHSSGVAPDVQVEVLPRRTTEVELALLPATTRTLVVKVAESDPAIRMKLKVNSCVGSYCWEYENAYRSRHNNFVFVVEGLVPDSYRVEASSPSSGRLVSEFEVLDLRPSPDVMLEF
jgi:hypothetical protein